MSNTALTKADVILHNIQTRVLQTLGTTANYKAASALRADNYLRIDEYFGTIANLNSLPEGVNLIPGTTYSKDEYVVFDGLDISVLPEFAGLSGGHMFRKDIIDRSYSHYKGVGFVDPSRFNSTTQVLDVAIYGNGASSKRSSRTYSDMQANATTKFGTIETAINASVMGEMSDKLENTNLVCAYPNALGALPITLDQSLFDEGYEASVPVKAWVDAQLSSTLSTTDNKSKSKEAKREDGDQA